MNTHRHPFDPLTPGEIQLVSQFNIYKVCLVYLIRQQAADILQRHVPNAGVIFRVITLWEPAKTEMVTFLDLEHGEKETPKRPARIAKVQAYVDKDLSEFKVDIDRQAVMAQEPLTSRHSHIDADYMRKAELACLADPCVKEQVAALKLPEGATVIAEPWTYGTDGMSDMTQRVTMVCLVQTFCQPSF
jgi:primary-amine oxidase